MTPRKLYGLAEIADAVGIRPNTVRQWYRRGKLPVATEVLAAGPVWRAAAIEEWIREHRERR